MKRIFPSEKGQALILIVVAVIGLLGLTALTIDGGNAYSDRRHAQNAADTSVLAAARAKIRGEVWRDAGYIIATENGYDNDTTSNVVVIYQCDEVHASGDPTCGLYQGSDEYIQVIITSYVNTYFAKIVGVSQITNKVMAIARVIPSTNEPMFDGNAVVGLAPHECKSVKYDGNAYTTVTGGGIYVNSDCDPAFFNNSTAGSLTASSLCTVGQIDATSSIHIPSQEEDCPPFPPSKYVYPNPDACGSTNAAKVGSDTLSPGNWTGHFPPNGVTTLQSGVYCVDGEFRVNAGETLIGSDVVIIMVDGDVAWEGGTIKLDGPPTPKSDTNPFGGLFLYMPESNDGTIIINGNSNSGFEGSVLAPSADITVNGTGDSGLNGQIIGYTVDLGGNSGVLINYDDVENYDALIAPSIELVQ